MRKLCLVVLLAAAACQQDSAAPPDTRASTASTAVESGGSGSDAIATTPVDGSLYYTAVIPRLPERLRLTAEQEAKIKMLLDAYTEATRVDQQTLAAIMKLAEEAKRAGKTEREILQIFAEADPVRTRLADAARRLNAAIEGVLTREQLAWLNNLKHPCDPPRFPLTDAQAAQIRALTSAFTTATKADADAVSEAARRAKEAVIAGKSREEVQAILDAVKPALDRLNAASQRLQKDIQALLTQDQREEGCFVMSVPVPGTVTPEPPKLPPVIIVVPDKPGILPQKPEVPPGPPQTTPTRP